MSKIKVGILTFSDGRDFVNEEVYPIALEFQRTLEQALRDSGEVEPIVGTEIVWTSDLARREAQRLSALKCEVTIFNFVVWSFPHFPTIAAQFAPKPILLFGNINPQYPGMVGLLAAAGALDQIGCFHARIFGDIRDPQVMHKVLAFLRAGAAINRLRGETFGLFGGRSMGMFTAVANPDQWMREFGIDVEHIDQWEIVRQAEKAPSDEVEHAFRWLTTKVGQVHYDGKQLTQEKLKLQIRSYIAVREMIKKYRLNFVGIKAQPELTNNFVTMDVTEALLNDPYDWNGPKEPVVAATEADMDGALTMEILKHISNQPVLFADLRHYDQEYDFFDLCNSGTHPTYFAGRSYDPDVNLPKVELYPQGLYFPAGGAAVRHFAAPGEVTLARLARKNGKYWLAIVPGEFIELPKEEAERKAREIQVNWPHAFAKLKVSPDELLSEYDSNHIHGVYGNYVDELIWVAKMLNISYRVFA